ncbi:MAG: phosphoglycolate phosphatase, partial [Alphaproteobacteria bacterium HGW-Alphaproteobacteria-8]
EGLRLGLCTNKPQRPAEKALAEVGLTPFFDAVVGGDIVALKPDPASLRLCLERLGADVAATLYVGDSETDADTAHAAETPFALFTQGYRKAPVEALAARFAFDHHAALPDWVLAPPAAR